VVGPCSRRGWQARQAHGRQNRRAQPKGQREGKLGPPYASTDWRSHAADADPRKVLGFDGQHLRRRQASDGTDGDNTNPV
jgi:hypothetical protein